MENELSQKIIGAAIEVHRTLGGPGLLESIYESALCHELSLRKIDFRKLGLLINFGKYHVTNGISRVVNGLA